MARSWAARFAGVAAPEDIEDTEDTEDTGQFALRLAEELHRDWRARQAWLRLVVMLVGREAVWVAERDTTASAGCLAEWAREAPGATDSAADTLALARWCFALQTDYSSRVGGSHRTQPPPAPQGSRSPQ